MWACPPAARSHLSGRNTLPARGGGGSKLRTLKAEQQHAVSRKGSRQVGFSQSRDPANHMGRPGQVHSAAGHRLRSLRDCVVSLPGKVRWIPRKINEESATKKTFSLV